MQACWGFDNTGCVIVQVNKGCKVQDLRGYLKHHSGNSHKIVRSGLAHVGRTTIALCVFFLFPLLFTYCKLKSHTNTFTLLNCFLLSDIRTFWSLILTLSFQVSTWELPFKLQINFKRVTIQTPPSLWLFYLLQLWWPQIFQTMRLCTCCFYRWSPWLKLSKHCETT